MTKTKLISITFYIFMIIFITLRFFLGRLYGVFALCVLIYYFCNDLLGFSPFTFPELLDWFNYQGEGTKNAILGAIITVLGFMIAYASTSQNWKAQELVRLKLKAADEIESYVAECSNFLNKAVMYAEWLMHVESDITKGIDVGLSDFLVKQNKEMSVEFIATRKSLSERAISVYQLQSRHSNLLNMTFGLDDEMDKITASIKNIMQGIWFPVPIDLNTSNNSVGIFMNQVTPHKQSIMEFIETANKHSLQMNGCAGSITGSLRAEIISFNNAGLRNMLKRRREFEQYLELRFGRNSKT